VTELIRLVEAHFDIAALLAAIFVALAVFLILGAFFQGREVSFWPPRIGPKPQGPAAPSLVPPPTQSEVTETHQLSPPDYGPFAFNKDIRVVDLRTRLPVPEDKIAERYSPVTWIRYTLVKKTRPANQLSFQFATTGVGLDPRCLTHNYSLKKAVEPDVHGERRLGENWEIQVDVSDVPLKEEFLVINEITYWNAFRGEDHDWAAIKAEQDTAEIALLLLFPQKKPYTSYELYAYPHGSEKQKIFAGESTVFPSKNHMTLF